MKKIAIIIPYFGALPPYFEIWLKSAERNKGFDFVIFTDDKKISKYALTDNIKVIIENFSEFRNRFQKKLSFKISMDYPYKICDYRPMYGIALAEFLKEYDYWGFGDFDAILGDLDKFVVPKLEENYDRVYNFGALSLYRNTSKMNNLFKERSDYRDCLSYKYVYTTNFSLYFDEMGGHRYGCGQSTIASRRKDINIFMNNECADVNPNFYNFELFISHEKYDYFEYNHGKLLGIRNGKKIREYVYLHLQKRNLKIDSAVNSEMFYIGPSLISSDKRKIIKNYKDKSKKITFMRNTVVRKSKNAVKLINQGAIKFIFNSLSGRINI